MIRLFLNRKQLLEPNKYYAIKSVQVILTLELPLSLRQIKTELTLLKRSQNIKKQRCLSENTSMFKCSTN